MDTDIQIMAHWVRGFSRVSVADDMVLFGKILTNPCPNQIVDILDLDWMDVGSVEKNVGVWSVE